MRAGARRPLMRGLDSSAQEAERPSISRIGDSSLTGQRVAAVCKTAQPRATRRTILPDTTYRLAGTPRGSPRCAHVRCSAGPSLQQLVLRCGLDTALASLDRCKESSRRGIHGRISPDVRTDHVHRTAEMGLREAGALPRTRLRA
jgi:hypothetical protein